MSDDRYITIAGQAEGLYKEKGSKFLAYALPVNAETEIREILQEYRKKYYDARHICYAYTLGKDRNIYNSSDAGEPPHTAGDPILHEIRASGFTNILVIVVRYFGGVKLGKSGLITAYREAARDCLHSASRVEKMETEPLLIQFSYENTSYLQALIVRIGAEIISSNYTDHCELNLLIPKSKINQARESLKDYIVNS